MIRSYKAARLVFILISLFLSLVTVTLLSIYSYPLNIVIDEIQILDDMRFNVYHDADKDGISERFTPYIYEFSGFTYVTLNSIVRSNDIGAYHLKRKISKSSQLFFGDFNHDNIDELIIYTINLDTLFVSILDLKKEHKYIDEMPLIVRDPLLHKDWDMNRVLGGLYDFDNDNNLELLTYIHTTHSVPMRGFILYDFEEKKITKEFISAVLVNEFYVTDLNNDNNLEVLFSTGSPGNFDRNLRYNDWDNKFMMLDSDLNVVYESDVLGIYPFSSNLSIFNNNGNTKIFFSVPQNRNLNNAYISKLNKDLTEVNRINFSNSVKSVSSIPCKIKNEDHLLVLNYGKDIRKIQIYTSDLELVNEIKFTGSFVIPLRYYLDENGNSVFICSYDNQIVIINSNLEILARENIPSQIMEDYYYFSIGYLGKNIHFLARNNEHQYYAHLEESLIHKNLFFIPLISFPFFYLLLVFVNSAALRIKKYFDSLKYLINLENSNVILIHHDGKLREINNDFMANLRISGDVNIGDNLLAKLPNDNLLAKTISNAVKNKIDKSYSEHIYNEFGIKEGEITITPLKSFLGYAYAYLIRIEDRTKIIQHERNLIWAKTAQKIAHDIKTPLSIIQLNLSSIKARIEKEFLNRKVDYFSDIDMIQDEIRRISKLTKDFLKFSNLEKPNFQSVSIKDELQRAVTHFTSFFKNGVEIEINIGDNDLIWGDPNQIEHLFNIFLENAIDAVGGNGYLSISTSEIIDTNTNNTFIQILIKDDGEGIKSEFLNKIYEPYFTTKIEGTGLGLAIAKKIIEDNNGTIDIDSTLGKGTIFKITFPKFSE